MASEKKKAHAYRKFSHIFESVFANMHRIRIDKQVASSNVTITRALAYSIVHFHYMKWYSRRKACNWLDHN